MVMLSDVTLWLSKFEPSKTYHREHALPLMFSVPWLPYPSSLLLWQSNICPTFFNATCGMGVRKTGWTLWTRLVLLRIKGPRRCYFVGFTLWWYILWFIFSIYMKSRCTTKVFTVLVRLLATTFVHGSSSAKVFAGPHFSFPCLWSENGIYLHVRHY